MSRWLNTDTEVKSTAHTNKRSNSKALPINSYRTEHHCGVLNTTLRNRNENATRDISSVHPMDLSETGYDVWSNSPRPASTPTQIQKISPHAHYSAKAQGWSNKTKT